MKTQTPHLHLIHMHYQATLGLGPTPIIKSSNKYANFFVQKFDATILSIVTPFLFIFLLKHYYRVIQ